PVSTVSRSASSFATGNTPGIPRQTGQTFVLGGAPNSLAQPHHIFDLVLSWTWVSSPMTASKSMIAIPFRPVPPRGDTNKLLPWPPRATTKLGRFPFIVKDFSLSEFD